MKRLVLAAVVALVLFCGLWTPVASGQAVYGSILGTVTDPSGAAVANAKVTATSQTKNTSLEATTNESGNYSVTHLIPDVYSVRVEGQGFKSLQFKDIPVSADTGVRVDGQFQVGGSSETVEVTSEAPQLKTDRLQSQLPEPGAAFARDADLRLGPRCHGESSRQQAGLREWPALQRHGIRTRRNR
jgi:hypothetical protein